MKPYEHLFWDLDHTLWDFEQNSARCISGIYEQLALQQVGIEDEQLFFQKFTMHNYRLWDRYQAGHMKQEELRWKRFWHTLLDFGVRPQKLAHEMSSLYLDLLPRQDALVPYAKDILKQCVSNGYQMHMITNGSEAVQLQKMRQSSIDHYFLQIFTSDRCQCRKPNKEIFDYALQATGATPDNSLMIGDNYDADIMGAMRCGMHQAYLNPNRKQHAAAPTYDISCLSELKDIL